MSGRLLPPEVNDLDAPIQTAIIDRRDTPASQSIDRVHFLARQRPDHRFTTVSYIHACSSQMGCRMMLENVIWLTKR